MNKFAKILPAAVAGVFLASATAFGTYIGFRDLSAPNTNHNARPSYRTTVDDLTMTPTAAGQDLWWNGEDGFGVRCSGYASDEIEHPETLCIEFDTPVYIEYILITGLFYEDEYFEIGWDSYGDPDNHTVFQQSDPNMTLGDTDGEYILEINGWADSIWSSSPGLIADEDHEFSVAGVYMNPTPEPATMLLFGSGLIGIAFLGRKKFFRK